MKFPFLILLFFLLSFLGITTLTLRAEYISEETVTRENYCECLQSVASQEDSSEFYGANIMAEGIVQTSTSDGKRCYAIADGIDQEAPIHELTRLQQENYCTWFQDQKKNKGTCCYLKNEVEKNASLDNQETVIVISSNEKNSSPLMMFSESEREKEDVDTAKQEGINRDRISAATDLSSLQQRGAQAATIKEASDDTSEMSELTHSDDASTRVPPYNQSPTELEKQITIARHQAFAATQELLQQKTFLQKNIEGLLTSYHNAQKTLASAYRLRHCLKKSDTARLQSYKRIVHGICREAEWAYNDAQKKLKTFSQLPGCTPTVHTFIEKAYANFSEAQKNLYTLKQQHEEALSTDPNSLSSTLVGAYEKSKDSSEIKTSSLSKINTPTAEEQEALRLEQFLKEHQWYAVGRGGKKIALGTDLPQEEHEVHISLQEKAAQAGTSIPTPPPPLAQTGSSAHETITAVDHALFEREEQLHEKLSQGPPVEAAVAISVAAPNKKLKKKKSVAEVSPAKSDADWESEIRAKFPLSSFALEKYDYDQFQENAARLVKSLIEDPAHASLFAGISCTACEDIKNLKKLDYVIRADDNKPIRALKEFIKKRVNEEYYPTYIQYKIRLAQSHTEEQERLSKLAAEAEKKLLAELEGEKQSKRNSATQKSKGNKK